MLPFVLAAAEVVMWRRLRREVFAYFGVLAAIVVGYLFLRSHYLHGFALPPRPYVFPPTDPGFVRFVFDKACYYILGEFLFVPCVPIGGLPFLREQALIFYGATAATGVVILSALWAARRTVRAVAASWASGSSGSAAADAVSAGGPCPAPAAAARMPHPTTHPRRPRWTPCNSTSPPSLWRRC